MGDVGESVWVPVLLGLYSVWVSVLLITVTSYMGQKETPLRGPQVAVGSIFPSTSVFWVSGIFKP